MIIAAAIVVVNNRFPCSAFDISDSALLSLVLMLVMTDAYKN